MNDKKPGTLLRTVVIVWQYVSLFSLFLFPFSHFPPIELAADGLKTTAN